MEVQRSGAALLKEWEGGRIRGAPEEVFVERRRPGGRSRETRREGSFCPAPPLSAARGAGGTLLSAEGVASHSPRGGRRDP